MYCGSNRTAPGGLHIPLTVPASVRSIKGDGNCFFRSISYVITGCEEQHESVRRAILIHMRAFGHLLFLWLNGRTIDNVEEYIQLSGMEKDGTWATDVEVFALSHLLGICLSLAKATPLDPQHRMYYITGTRRKGLVYMPYTTCSSGMFVVTTARVLCNHKLMNIINVFMRVKSNAIDLS